MPLDYRRKAAELREKRGEVCDQAGAIVVLAETEKRGTTSDEQKQIDDLLAESDRLVAEADRYDRLSKFQAECLNDRSLPAAVSGDTPEHKPVIVPMSARFRHSAKLTAFASSPQGEADAYKSGQFILATMCGSPKAAQWCREHGVDIQAAMTTGTNTLGGYLVPEEMERSIIELREERGVFRRYATSWPMGSDSLVVPRRSSGITVYFVGDNTEITASDPGLDQVQLVAKKMAALVKYSSELSEDAVINLADFLTREIAYGFADKEDQCGFNGDGTSTYGGIVGVKNALAAGSVYTAASGNTAFSTLDLADFEGVVGQLPEYARANARWFIHRAGWAASMMRLADAAGGNTTQNIMGGVGPSFLGYPVVFTQVMNSTLTAQVSTAGLAYFGDLAQSAALGTRRGTNVMTSSERYFELDQLAVKATQRVDINVHERGTASVAGSIIGLTTPAS